MGLVRLRNWMKEKDLNFGLLSEYNQRGRTAKVRNGFRDGKLDMVLYSERMHFFRRLRIQGIRHLIFYAPPQSQLFYSEMVRTIMTDNDVTCTLLFCVYDTVSLQRIVGSTRHTKLLTTPHDTSVFC